MLVKSLASATHTSRDAAPSSVRRLDPNQRPKQQFPTLRLRVPAAQSTSAENAATVPDKLMHITPLSIGKTMRSSPGDTDSLLPTQPRVAIGPAAAATFCYLPQTANPRVGDYAVYVTEEGVGVCVCWPTISFPWEASGFQRAHW